MVNKSEIVCITVLYNPTADLIRNIRYYNNFIGKVILVDNSNKNNQHLFINMDNVDYIPLMENTGIAHAINVGIKRSTENYILTMDQDSTLSADLINAYLNFLNTYDANDIGAITPQYDTDRNHAKKLTGSKEVLLSMQSGTLFKRSTFEKIGLFNEDLFLDVVDWEYFLRMNSVGLKLIQVDDAILVHQPATTKELNLGFFKLKYGVASPVRYYYQSRNLLWTAKKYRSRPLYKNLIVKWLKIVLLFNDKSEYLKLFRQGIRDAKNNKLGKIHY